MHPEEGWVYVAVAVSAPQVPYMYDWVNHVRAASFTCVLFCTIMLAFSIYHPGVEWDDADGIKDYRQKVRHWGCAAHWLMHMENVHQGLYK
jgi:hypothetical protein